MSYEKIIDMLDSSQKETRGDLKALEIKMDQRLEALTSKVDDVLRWKWGIIGGSVVVSGILTVVFQFVLALIQRQ